MTGRLRPRRASRWPAGMLLCVLAAAGCSTGADAGRSPAPGAVAGSAATGSTEPGTPATGSTAAAAPPSGFSTDLVRVDDPAPGRLVSVSGDTADGVDRLTFTFAGAAPGYRVERVGAVRTGAGRPDDDVVELAGRSFLGVGFTSTTPSVDGALSPDVPANTELDLPLLRQVVLVRNVAGDLRFGVGLSVADPVFRVETRSGPSRVVVEVTAR